jgi:hypothetical protein
MQALSGNWLPPLTHVHRIKTQSGMSVQHVPTPLLDTSSMFGEVIPSRKSSPPRCNLALRPLRLCGDFRSTQLATAGRQSLREQVFRSLDAVFAIAVVFLAGNQKRQVPKSVVIRRASGRVGFREIRSGVSSFEVVHTWECALDNRRT